MTQERWLPPSSPGSAAPERPADVGGSFAPPAGAAPGTYGAAPVTRALDEQIAPAGAASYELADFGNRAAAAAVDFVVRLGLVLAGALLGSIAFAGGTTAGEVGLIAGAGLGWVLGSLAYAPVMMARTDGRTIGHRAAGTRVVRADGTRLTGGQAFVREVLVKLLLIETAGSFFFLLPILVNYLLPLFDKGNEALHDKICSTRVVIDR